MPDSDRIPLMRICISDAGPLTPHNDAGSRATSDLIQTLESLSHHVSFTPVSEVDDLRDFDLFIASRPGPAVHALALPGFDEVPSVFFGHDLHFQRMVSVVGHDKAEAFRRLEMMCWRSYDLTVYPSSEEADYVNLTLGELRAVQAPIFVMGDAELGSAAKSPEPSCVFVGSASHEPNQASVEVLIENIWPGVRECSAAQLHLVGDWQIPETVQEELSISIHTSLSEMALNNVVSASWLSLAPLPFGAGVKRKVIHALHCGTPVVGTRFAFQGIDRTEGGGVWGGVQADDAASAVACTLELLADPAVRAEKSQEGQAWVQSHYSSRSSLTRWSEIVNEVQRGYRPGS